MNSFSTFSQILEPYQQMIESALKKNLSQLGPKSALRDACEYALLNGGKRFRPALVFMIAKALGNLADVTPCALGIEFFHTASLIADDLPCMDNDDMRRNKPALHKVFGESAALLATYALISAGYACIAQNSTILKDSSHPFAHLRDHLCLLAVENASFNTGLCGAAGGQYLDLNPSNLSLDLVKEVIYKKTVTLFEISFVFGWLFGGGDLSLLDLVKKSAYHFGMAFQIADDLEDYEQDSVQQNSLNIAHVLGIESAIKMFHEEISEFNHILQKLKLEDSDLFLLGSHLQVGITRSSSMS